MSVSDVAKISGVTFAESEWKNQVQKSRPTKNMIKPAGRYAMDGTALINRKGGKRTLCCWKFYLDSCVLYHTFFSEEFLMDIEERDAAITGRYNAGTTVRKMKRTYGDFQVWLNNKVITKLISVPMMEASGYIVSTHTHGDWVVTTPECKDITFIRDKGVCTCVP